MEPHRKKIKFDSSNDLKSLKAKMQDTLEKKFQGHFFRTNQLESMLATLAGKDTFVLMPTGAGKSLCYMLPAHLSAGLTVVVMPLKSLIQDQLRRCENAEIAAEHIHANMPKEVSDNLFSRLLKSDSIKIIFMTPEMLVSNRRLKATLYSLNHQHKLERRVFDEAHCVIQWGNDFRPAYKKLQWLKSSFPKVPIMALSACAKQEDVIEIERLLNLQNTEKFSSSFNRDNLKYCVIQKENDSTADALNTIKNDYPNMSGIVYCWRRKETEETAKAFRNEGLSCASFHAGLSDNERCTIQTQWQQCKIKVIIATIAFGLGIDKPNVRFIIHLTLPKTLDGYYQETGRGGRDGAVCDCILYYKFQDYIKLCSFQQGQNFENPFQGVLSYSLKVKDTSATNQMCLYASNKTDCRRKMILNILGENRLDSCRQDEVHCDNCESQLVWIHEDVSEQTHLVTSLVQDLTWHSNVTATLILNILKGRKNKATVATGNQLHPLYGILRNWKTEDIEVLIQKLILNGHLNLQYLKNVKDFFNAYLVKGTSTCQVTIPKLGSENIHMKCLKELQTCVQRMAYALGLNAHDICDIQKLKSMASKLPLDWVEMVAILPQTKMMAYGEPLLNITSRYAIEIKNN